MSKKWGLGRDEEREESCVPNTRHRMCRRARACSFARFRGSLQRGSRAYARCATLDYARPLFGYKSWGPCGLDGDMCVDYIKSRLQTF